MFLKTTKFHEILLSGCRGVALTNCFCSISNFVDISKFKRSVPPRNRHESEIPSNMHLHSICMSIMTTTFHEILLSGFITVVLTNCKSSTVYSILIKFLIKFKRGITPMKQKLNQSFLYIWTSTHYILPNYKVSRNYVERYQSSPDENKQCPMGHIAHPRKRF